MNARITSYFHTYTPTYVHTSTHTYIHTYMHAYIHLLLSSATDIAIYCSSGMPFKIRACRSVKVKHIRVLPHGGRHRRYACWLVCTGRRTKRHTYRCLLCLMPNESTRQTALTTGVVVENCPSTKVKWNSAPRHSRPWSWSLLPTTCAI